MKVFHGSVPKEGKRPKKKRRGMARPDEPLKSSCEIGRIDVCTGRAEERHHRLMRSQGGTDVEANTLDVCRACHDFAHANRSLAKAHGWIYEMQAPSW